MSEKYFHGVRVEEERETSGVTVNATSGLQVVFGTAPVNLADSPEKAVNVPVLCRTMEEAKSKLGYSRDFASYTLCQAMYAGFELFGVAPVVFINVLDPAEHKRENGEKEYNVANGQVKVDVKGILKSSVTVKRTDEGTTQLENDRDYVLSFDDEGNLIITLIAEVSEGTVKVTCTSIDPSMVDAEDLIGGYDAETGKESGLEVLRQVYPRTGMAPGLILAPGWSHKPEVAAVMASKCENINGAFRAECLIDLDTAETKLYTDVPEAKEKCGCKDPHAILLWPKTSVGGVQLYYSAVYGALTAYMDATNDNVPNLYPSNRLAGIDAAVLEDGTEVFMDREQANTLNGEGIVTLVNEGGWRAWGNNTSAYPDVTDAKDRWIACRRMFTWMANSLIVIYHERVDSPANYRLIESICDSENIRLNSYVSAGKLPGARIEYNEEENSVENVLTGQIIFRIYMAAFTPAEDILFILRFDPDILAESLAGNGGEA